MNCLTSIVILHICYDRFVRSHLDYINNLWYNETNCIAKLHDKLEFEKVKMK